LKILRLIVLGAVCLALGAAAGYKFALVREQGRLERNKALVRRIHAAWSEPSLGKAVQAVQELYAPGFVLHDWTGDDASGLDGAIKSVYDNHADFPDWTERPEAIIAEGDFVVDRFLSTGTQARDLQPIPHHSPGVPNRGRFLRMPEIAMFRFVDGKLAELWDFADIWGAEV